MVESDIGIEKNESCHKLGAVGEGMVRGIGSAGLRTSLKNCLFAGSMT
jgi:hypothetical protein